MRTTITPLNNQMTFLSSLLSFDATHKHRIHIAQIVLTLLAIILSFGRVAVRNPPATRANTVAITMVSIYHCLSSRLRALILLRRPHILNLGTNASQGLKSLVVIAYQLLTEHHARFRKFASTKANAVLNCLEIIFWLAVLVVTGMEIGRASGAAAAVSALTLVAAIFLE
jgi:hypothetical protein